MFEFSELPTSRKIILEPMTSNVVISEVDVPMCVVLRKAENPYLMENQLFKTGCMMLQPRCHANEVVITACNSI